MGGEMDPQVIDELCARVVAGDERAVARALRWVDERWEGYLELLSALYQEGGRAHLIGVTGAAGAGKSTLVDTLVTAYRLRDLRVGVLAIDPSSPFSGGAVLGDRVRMQKHFLDREVFIRSVGTRGAMGGLSQSATDQLCVLDAAGCDVIVVETVGVGQDEVEVVRRVDSTVVVVAPGMGDHIQAMKAGLLEIADIFVVNKADRPGADATVQQLEQMLALGELQREHPGGSAHSMHASGHIGVGLRREDGGASDAWQVPCLKTVASRNEGIEVLVDQLGLHVDFLRKQSQGSLPQKRHQVSAVETFRSVLQELLWCRISVQERELLEHQSTRVSSGDEDPYRVAQQVVDRLFEHLDHD